MKIKRDDHFSWKWFFVLVFIAIIFRIIVVMNFEPSIVPDSDGYLEMAQKIQQGNLIGDMGIRTPIYPLFLLAFNLDLKLIILAQLILGVAISIMLYFIAQEILCSNIVSFCAGLYYAINLCFI
jgi:hypothetical protein